MSRRETVQQNLRQRMSVLLKEQGASLLTGPVDHAQAKLFMYYGAMLRALPHYSETELLGIQRHLF